MPAPEKPLNIQLREGGRPQKSGHKSFSYSEATATFQMQCLRHMSTGEPRSENVFGPVLTETSICKWLSTKQVLNTQPSIFIITIFYKSALSKYSGQAFCRVWVRPKSCHKYPVNICTLRPLGNYFRNESIWFKFKLVNHPFEQFWFQYRVLNLFPFLSIPLNVQGIQMVLDTVYHSWLQNVVFSEPPLWVDFESMFT